MRGISWIFLILLGMAGAAEARQSEAVPDRKNFDVVFTVAGAEMKQATNPTLYADDWYGTARYAVAIGGYWTEHLKTEVEYARFGEGSLFYQDYKRLPGSAQQYPFHYEIIHRVEHLSLRMTWQFGNNSWIHPYLSGGVAGERDRLQYHTEVQYLSLTGRAQDTVQVTPLYTATRRYDYNVAVTAEGGAKFYVSRSAFIKSGLNWTYSTNPRISLFAGFGIDF